jgi:hypothetical protein
VHAEPPAAIYDPAVLHGFQMRLGVNATLPFLYPPGILLLLWPLALCSYVAAFALWIGITLAIYLASLWRRRGWALATLMVLAAPASAICAGLGQTGFLVGGLLIAGLRLAPGRPVLAGIVLGLAAVKPQLVLLLPLALASARLWRCLVAAAATVLALMLLSSFLLGWRIWPEWAAAAPLLADAVAGLKSTLLPMMPTVAGNAELLGAGSTVVVLVQVAAAGIAAWAIWRAFRNGPGAAAVASLLAGQFPGHAVRSGRRSPAGDRRGAPAGAGAGACRRNVPHDRSSDPRPGRLAALPDDRLRAFSHQHGGAGTAARGCPGLRRDRAASIGHVAASGLRQARHVMAIGRWFRRLRCGGEPEAPRSPALNQSAMP